VVGFLNLKYLLSSKYAKLRKVPVENAVRYGNSCYLRFFLVENSQRFSLSTDETATPDDFPAHLANLGLSKTAMEKQKFRHECPV
jgi:hypothetical protein